jgi:hypothetical protein
MKSRIISGIIVGLIVFGGVFALAATLGGITSNKVAADNVAVASCDTDGVATAYTTAWDATDKRYEVSNVTVSNINNACDGQTLKVTLADSTGASLGEGTLTIPTDALSTSATVAITGGASAKLTEAVHVLIAA